MVAVAFLVTRLAFDNKCGDGFYFLDLKKSSNPKNQKSELGGLKSKTQRMGLTLFETDFNGRKTVVMVNYPISYSLRL